MPVRQAVKSESPAFPVSKKSFLTFQKEDFLRVNSVLLLAWEFCFALNFK